MLRSIPLALSATLLLGAAPPAAKPGELICGWLSNPTPGNWWITDRTREWTLSTQGGPGVPGWDEMTYDPSEHEYVRTNGSYGYGCACARMSVDRRTGSVRRIHGISARPLAACRQDKALKRP